MQTDARTLAFTLNETRSHWNIWQKSDIFECMLYKPATLLINCWGDKGRNEDTSQKIITIIHSKLIWIK